MVVVPPFDAFLEEHREVVYRFLVAAVGPDDADDCFQETFISALRAYGRLIDGSNLRGWVLTIAQKRALDAYRSRRKSRRVAEATRANGEPTTRDALPGDEDGDVWRAVRDLPARQQSAVLHRFVNDLAYAEIGRVMGTTEEAARQNVHSGLKKLRSTNP